MAMKLATAVEVFRELEAHRYEEGNDGIFDVRLDAFTSKEDYTRDFRIRVTPGGGIDHYAGGETLGLITSVATAFDLEMHIANSGIELLLR